jgi:hypothetical protein
MRQSADTYGGQLSEFYRQNHIAVGLGFDCPHLSSCQAATDRHLVHGAEAFVGSNYGERLRVVAVSLDAGGESKTLSQKRLDVESMGWPTANRHMPGTMLVLQALLGLSAEVSPFPFAAMTNSAKCSGKGSRQVAPDALFDNCRPFALKELAILRPHVVVTQGVKAHRALAEARAIPDSWLEGAVGSLPAADPPVQAWLQALAETYLRVWPYDSAEAVVMDTPHPAAHAGQFQHFCRSSLEPLAWLVREMFTIAASGT